jgi:hypothetical protein
MGVAQIAENDSAVLGIDFIAAIVLVIMAVIMAIQVMPTLSHEDRDWRIKQYMTASRAADILVQDAGNPEDWKTDWMAKNYSNVTKIGFVYVNASGKANLKELDEMKVNASMMNYTDVATNLSWWEFPDVHSKPWDGQEAGQANFTRVLGLDGYNFYMQLSPVALNGSNFNYTPLDIASINRSKLPINYETASMIDRYVYIHGSCGEGYLCYNGSTVHYRLNLWVW